MNFIKEISVSDWVQVIAIIVAIILGITSIYQNNRQLKISNKQSLFDRRFEVYRLLQHIDKLCADNIEFIDYTKDKLIDAKFDMVFLTNSNDFYHLCDIFDEKGCNLQKDFLSRIEKIKDMGMQATLIFPEIYSIYIQKYFENYANLISELRKYYMLIENIKSLREKLYMYDENYIKECQQKQLSEPMAQNIINNLTTYKNNLQNLHMSYDKNIVKLIKYLSLTERR